MKALWLLPLLLCAAGCRTQLAPLRKPEPRTVYIGDKTCSVYDFPSATDLPEGSKSLGWVQVDKAETDDETFIKLREKVCELGGNALSQIAWVTKAGEYEPSVLKGNAWAMP